MWTAKSGAKTQTANAVRYPPDTVITLVNHEKLVVKEPVDEVVKRVMQYSREVRSFRP